jgi:hypothetical protein
MIWMLLVIIQNGEVRFQQPAVIDIPFGIRNLIEFMSQNYPITKRPLQHECGDIVRIPRCSNDANLPSLFWILPITNNEILFPS